MNTWQKTTTIVTNGTDKVSPLCDPRNATHGGTGKIKLNQSITKAAVRKALKNGLN